MKKETFEEVMRSYWGAIDKMLEESPSFSSKRQKLTNNIDLLRDSKLVYEDAMDKIATCGT